MLHTIFTAILASEKTVEMALTKFKFRDTVFSYLQLLDFKQRPFERHFR